jgi:hypothetical protein
MLRNIWLARSDRYSEIRSRVRLSEEAQRSDARRKIEMFYIGG